MGQIIRDWNKVSDALNRLRKKGKRIVSTNGVFDVLHVGHVRYLKAARALGDCLIVGVNSDESTHRLKGPSRPFVGENERMELLAALSVVDFVTPFNEATPEALLEVVRPNIHAKGGDYHLELLPEAAAVRKNGGEVVSIPLEEGYSTTSLTERIASILAQQG